MKRRRNRNRKKKLENEFHQIKFKIDVENVVVKALCILQAQISYLSKLQNHPPAPKHRGFLSHVQKHSADLCRSLYFDFKNVGINVWFDMEADRIDARGMIPGIHLYVFYHSGDQENF